MFSFAIGFSEQEDDLLAREILLLESSFRAVKVFDRIAFLELAFERLEHDRVDFPIFIATDTIGDFGVLDANVGHNLNGFVILSEIAERRPTVVVLSSWAKWQYQKKD